MKRYFSVLFEVIGAAAVITAAYMVDFELGLAVSGAAAILAAYLLD